LVRALGLLALSCHALARGEPLGKELLVFGSAQAAGTPGYDDTAQLGDGLLLSADVLLTLQYAQFRLFGEYLATNREHDLERLQLGWTPTVDTTVWVGRYHQLASVWNHEHHHGQFLQTSITRPAVENWEDDDGIIPQHHVGALLENRWHLAAGHTILTGVSGGYTAVLNRDGLEPFDGTDHRLGFQARLAWLPGELNDSGVGLLFATSRINADPSHGPIAIADLDHVDQHVFGVYTNYSAERWSVVSSLYGIDAADVLRRGEDRAQFAAGYVQAELQLTYAVRGFARHEFSVNASDAQYLQLFPSFARARTSLGGRWDFTRRQALTVEVSDTHTLIHHFGELRLQWSAALL
jgi:hypothetical protein